MQRAFVTGATGFIGTHLVERLLERGCEVRCLVRPTSRASLLPTKGVIPVTGTLDEPASYRDAVSGCDVVFHLGGLVAAAHADDLFRTNGTGTQLLADACATGQTPPRLVFLSSLAAAGPPPLDRAFRDEGDGPAPISEYGRSKRAGEVALQQRAHQLPITILRPGIVYGPRDPKVAALFQAIARTGLHFTIGFQTPRLSLLYVADMVEALIAAAERGERLDHRADGEYSPTGYYLTCDDREHPTYRQFGQLAADAIDRRVFVWPLWRWVGKAVGLAAETIITPDGKRSMVSLDKVREATAWSWACSSAKARADLGLTPRMPLRARLRETADWFRVHDWL